MRYCIIIRGPAGVGKTTIAKQLALSLGAEYFSFDQVMEDNKLDTIVGDGIPAENFMRANDLIIPLVMQKGKAVLDGCFYRKEQLDHLLHNLKIKTSIFTLDAGVEDCVKRNIMRNGAMTEEDIKQVHVLVSKLKVGTFIETKGKSVSEVLSEIRIHLNL
ncbi:MAG: AAA family ATPase [Candidatus Woesearchaeota archaeon]